MLQSSLYAEMTIESISPLGWEATVKQSRAATCNRHRRNDGHGDDEEEEKDCSDSSTTISDISEANDTSMGFENDEPAGSDVWMDDDAEGVLSLV